MYAVEMFYLMCNLQRLTQSGALLTLWTREAAQVGQVIYIYKT